MGHPSISLPLPIYLKHAAPGTLRVSTSEPKSYQVNGERPLIVATAGSAWELLDLGEPGRGQQVVSPTALRRRLPWWFVRAQLGSLARVGAVRGAIAIVVLAAVAGVAWFVFRHPPSDGSHCQPGYHYDVVGENRFTGEIYGCVPN